MVEGNMVAVLDAVGDAVVAVDREWRITYLNAAAVRWFRSEAADLLHRSIWSAFPDLAQARLFEKLHRAVAEQAATTDETYDPAHDSWSLIRAQPFADGLLIFASDVTDQKRREDRIAKLQALTAALSVVLGRDEVADVIVDHT
ncbi:MAG: hypothetical protein QOJ59_2216, partial [Thermomicrobiales bacterium]|nr:hypothetical protein [Thermomicrobiales bacterium]